MNKHKRKKEEKCPFCGSNIKTNFNEIYFSDIGKSFLGEGWIDYKKKKFGKDFYWYAKLNGDQYTPGNTLVILGKHMDKITDIPKKKELKLIILGINRVASRLKEKLKVETVHVLSLCESQKHLHFHLIPRFNYSAEEKEFIINNYKIREKDNYNEFIQKVKENKFHGMWYAAYQEMNYKRKRDFKQDINPNLKRERFFGKNISKRVENIENLAKLLRPEYLKNPFK